MSTILVVILILFLVGAFGGGHLGYYPTTYGYGGGVGLVLLIVLILALSGRL